MLVTDFNATNHKHSKNSGHPLRTFSSIGIGTNTQWIDRDFLKMVYRDFTGVKKHNYEVISLVEKKRGGCIWMCKCKCGSFFKLNSKTILYGSIDSCGCTKDIFAKYHNRIKHGNAIRGMKTTPEYNSWKGMNRRCGTPKNPRYKDYGGRGIIVCDRWKTSFSNFFEDMGYKPTPKHSIDRIDVNGDYEPNNCRWATRSEQDRGMRKNRWMEAFGIRRVISDWARELNVAPTTLYYHIKVEVWSK